MNKVDIKLKINELKESLDIFEGNEKKLKKIELNRLVIKLESTIVSEIAEKMNSIELTDIESMDQQIQAAKDANRSHTNRVQGFNKAFNLLKSVLL